MTANAKTSIARYKYITSGLPNVIVELYFMANTTKTGDIISLARVILVGIVILY